MFFFVIEDIGFEKHSSEIYFQSYLKRKSIYEDRLFLSIKLDFLSSDLGKIYTQKKADVC